MPVLGGGQLGGGGGNLQGGGQVGAGAQVDVGQLNNGGFALANRTRKNARGPARAQSRRVVSVASLARLPSASQIKRRRAF